MSRWILRSLFLSLLAVGCGSEAEAPPTAPETPPATPEAPPATPEPTPEPAGPCPTTNTLTIQHTDRSPNLDGVPADFTPTMAFANVSFGSSLSLAFTTYTIERGQFGISVPTGIPTVPEGGMIFRMELSGSPLAVGEYTTEGGSGGRLAATSFFHSRGRVLPLAPHQLTITELTDDHVCGELSVEGDSASPAVVGRFRADIPPR
ncbi:MAG: hypothetical protein H6721_04955 [Sandaracinus sp.]|nr:hypothetical protein [Sandaracinus sp.]MCB9631477.1 hypothetical protein [Sandaracinus sp.]